MKKNEKGFALIPAILILALIGAFATGYVTINKTGAVLHKQALQHGQAPTVNK
jgi:hypothetical protein